ncbi:hypothetical protein [Peijinzhouia sedimentorum]
MKLEKILSLLNSFEKNSFLKIIDQLIANNPKNIKEIDKILSDSNKDLKSIDNINISKVFSLLEDEFSEFVKCEFVNTSSQLDILIDIIYKDGNAIIKQDWFSRLYELKINEINRKVKTFKKNLEGEQSDFSIDRIRDYKIYLQCLKTAYFNDEDNNQEKKVTTDEQSILLALANALGLSYEETKLINYLILPVKKHEIDSVINELKSIGVIFFSRKNSTIYVADEVVHILRKVRGKEISDKFFRRVLKLLKEPQINAICRRHSIDWKLDLDEKIKLIINEGISFTGVLTEDIHKKGSTLTDKKKYLNELFEKGLQLDPKGVLIEDKIANLISYFETLERDERIGISMDGYEKLLRNIEEILPKFNNAVRKEFEFQEEKVLSSTFLIDFNIKPRDIIELLTDKELEEFCAAKEIKTRGDKFSNILEKYKDSENLYLESYEDIGFRNLASLKASGIVLKEAELGVKFEELTKSIFTQLGYDVDESIRKSLNTNKDRADIIINEGNDEIIIIECKSVKESGYNKFSSVFRQIKAYVNKANSKGYKVTKSLLVAPDFSDDFIKECGLEYELNLSLIKAGSLIKILNAFKASKLKVFPHNLLMKDVLVQDERVLKALEK